jgi:hypothetical protein
VNVKGNGHQQRLEEEEERPFPKKVEEIEHRSTTCDRHLKKQLQHNKTQWRPQNAPLKGVASRGATAARV